MEMDKEIKVEDSAKPVTMDSNNLQRLSTTEGQNEGLGLGLSLEREMGLGLGLDSAHDPKARPTSEVIVGLGLGQPWPCTVKPEDAVLDEEDMENSALVATELSILPLLDVGLGPKPKKNFQGDNISSLSVIANYGSSSESDSDSYSDNNRYFKPSNVVASTPSVIRSNSNKPVDYRTIQRSSSDDSDSDSESSDDESSSSSSSTDGPSRNAKVAPAKLVAKKNVPVTKGEVTLEDLPPIEDLHISIPEHACIEIGTISSIVDQQVIIQAKKGVPAMDLGSLLFLEKGKRTLGEIFDVFGQVTEPFYSVRFNSAEHVQQKGIEKGMTVFCAPQTEHTSYVFVQELMKLKGTDASWEYNNEPPPQCIDYSDDEEERISCRSKRNVDREEHSDLDMDPTPRKRVNSFERRMNERNLRKSALPPDPVTLGVGRGTVRGRRHLASGRVPLVKSQFGWNHYPSGRGRPVNIAFGVAPMQHPVGNPRMGQPMNYGPMQSPGLAMPPQANGYGPIQPPSHAMPPQANGQPCAIMGIRPNGPPTEYRSARRQPPNVQPPMQPPNTNGQPMGYVAAPIQFSPYMPPVMDNGDGQYPPYGVLGFMSPQTFQGGPRNNSFFSSPPPGFGAVPSFPNRVRPRSFQAMYGQLPPMFYPEYQPPQLPPGALPNALATLFTRPPPPPPNGGV